ncbi:MAG: hypothetical protein IJ198_01015 [Lachnospiraceae bacterium]|nr:hypothetical protein [Lachnospiraceae bacterium]
MKKRVYTALLAMILPLAVLPACADREAAENGTTAASAHAPASETGVQKQAVDHAENGRERSKESGKKKDEAPATAEKSAEDEENGRKSADSEVTGEKSGADEGEEQKDKEEKSVSDDPLERETDSQEQVWEPEIREEDREEREKENADEEQGERTHEEKTESAHEHTWVEQTKTVRHDETGHYEEVEVGTRTVIDEEAYEEPVYQAKCICSACGCETDSAEEMNDHLDSHYDPDLGYIDAGYSVQQVVIDTVYHPEVSHEEPVYEQQWVVDSEAYEETVVTGYKCSTCGAVR